MLEAYCTSGSSPTNGGEPYFHRENHGSVFLLRPVFPAAFNSIERQILEETMWFSDALTTEHRFRRSTLVGIQKDGIEVRSCITPRQMPCCRDGAANVAV